MALPTEPGIKRRGTVPRKFITGTIGATPWRVKQTDRLPRWNSACNSAKPTGGGVDAGTVNGSAQRHGTNGAPSTMSKNAKRKLARGHKRAARY